MKAVSKFFVGVGTAAMLSLSLATPALARHDDRYRRDHGRIDVGDVVVGALVLGGVAAVANSASRGYGYDRDGRYGRYGYGNRYAGSERAAVSACAREAERESSRYSHGYGRVYDITDVDRDDGYYRVRGRMQVENRGDWRRDRDWDDRNRSYDRYDNVSFSCVARGGRVYDVRINDRDYSWR